MTSESGNQIEHADHEWLDLWQRGRVRARWTKIPLQSGDIAPDF